ncbi:hypothetical protein V1515DRAFT_603499 [Lipomyces mesembrius]
MSATVGLFVTLTLRCTGSALDGADNNGVIVLKGDIYHDFTSRSAQPRRQVEQLWSGYNICVQHRYGYALCLCDAPAHSGQGELRAAL